ncbi:hypothetical protein DPMN_185063 [Dreissena polymorpha]|uniref:Uncharacterized protein n=1 Tax=Dreissena polymorpha TaxID=45954 RepID=A0A9D4I565_DREPO|nr:hypothetical protein DPMN_185063 [Dreissena polymorpha]
MSIAISQSVASSELPPTDSRSPASNDVPPTNNDFPLAVSCRQPTVDLLPSMTRNQPKTDFPLAVSYRQPTVDLLPAMTRRQPTENLPLAVSCRPLTIEQSPATCYQTTANQSPAVLCWSPPSLAATPPPRRGPPVTLQDHTGETVRQSTVQVVNVIRGQQQALIEGLNANIKEKQGLSRQLKAILDTFVPLVKVVNRHSRNSDNFLNV